MNKPSLTQKDGLWRGQFIAMASPCELLMDFEDGLLANIMLDTAFKEAIRIEHKFSRYRKDNIIYKINNAQGNPVEVDEETCRLFDYANTCYELSDGMFDISSGVLREIWRFDGSSNVPSESQVKGILNRIGWEKIQWRPPRISLKPNMEIDLGGLGKEYAVDHCAKLLRKHDVKNILINFGGDIVTLGPQCNSRPWQIGVDDPYATGKRHVQTMSLSTGAIATSGDARRYLEKNGIRYSHILNPKTGWPVQNAPRSVTVKANTCMEAGMLATFAMLHGEQAEVFLNAQNVENLCIR